MKNDFKRFDMAKPPVRTRWFLKPLTKLLSLPDMIKHRPFSVTKIALATEELYFHSKH